MEYILVPLTALLASLLTFFSGFGLGTLLTPVMALFFPLHEAILLTALVHLSNNLFKFLLTRKSMNYALLFKFGLPAMLGAFLGAQLLYELQDVQWLTYSLAGKTFHITRIGFIAGLVILIFALWEMIPKLNQLEIGTQWVMPGGLLSGFFGGLTGNQGALRSAFLIRFKLDKETFIATGIGIACMIDITRIPMYLRDLSSQTGYDAWPLLATTALSAFTGAFLGNKYLKKTTLETVQKIVAGMLILISLLIMGGII